MSIPDSHVTRITPAQAELPAKGSDASPWKTIKVLIADDHAMVRGAFVRLIDSEPDLQVVAQAHDGVSTLKQLENTPCDVLLLDLNMPEPSGSQLISLIPLTRAMNSGSVSASEGRSVRIGWTRRSDVLRMVTCLV